MSYQEKQPRIVEPGQRVPAFEFPLDYWNGYSSHLTMNPGKSSRLLLHSSILPDLRFFTVIQNSNENFLRGSEDVQWPICVEADQRHLLALNMVEGIGFPPAVFGGSGMSLRHNFLPEYWRQVNRLGLHYFVPEGEYLALPNKADLNLGRLSFDRTTKIGDWDQTVWFMASDPNDEDYLRAVDIMFEIRDINEDEIPPQPSMRNPRRRGFVFN
jgi:hypothetical protein